MVEVNIPTGYGIPLVNLADKLLPDPTMDALDERYEGLADEAITEATIRQRPVVTSTAPQGSQREYPKLTQPLNGPILTRNAPGQTLNSLYWPWLVDRWQGNPGTSPSERYALVFSTDHAVEPAPRIGWATAPAVTGPWTARGMLYKDTDAGSQTETPSIIWDEVTAKWLMFYQQKGVGVGDQSTLLAASPDFTTWTRLGIVAQQEAAFPGVGHMGYFRPFRWAGRWYAYSLAGQGYMTMWYSADGYQWERDARVTPTRPDLIQHLPGYNESAQWILKWTGATVLNWNGSPWVIMPAGAYAPGGEEVQEVLVAAPLSGDFRTVLSRPVNITPPMQDWQTITQGLGGFVTANDGHVYGVQRANGASSGAFFLLEVV